MNVPFNVDKFNDLLAAASVDLLLVHTRHNVRYLTGGYYYHFHAVSTRMDRSRYIPFLCIPRGNLEKTFFVCRHEEHDQLRSEELWIPNWVETIRGTRPAAQRLIEAIRAHGLSNVRIAVEMSFIPADVYTALVDAFPDARFSDASPILESLRAVKSDREIEHIRSVYDRTAEAVHEAFTESREGDTTAMIESRVRVAMAKRNLTFLFALISAGPHFSRAPSDRIRWERGQILHIDAGGGDDDYIADICRTGCMGEPPPLAAELHEECQSIIDAVRETIRPDVPVNSVLAMGRLAAERTKHARYCRFVVHGTGMVPHEQPYFSPDERRPLEPGMVISIETDFLHPDTGHLKIEESVVVTGSGCDELGRLSREWYVPS